MLDLSKLLGIASQIRRDIVRMVHQVNSGHPGGSLGCVEYFVALYGQIMNYSTDFKMNGRNEDLFFLSNGHISPVFYSTLSRFGFFDKSELHTFRKLNSRLQGHPTTHEGLPGIRVASGSLGQGLSVAIGAAISKKLNNDSTTVFTLMGDGEMQEGQVWEALMYASGKQVDNLIATIDYNGRQIDGDTQDVMPLGDLKAKLIAFGWEVLEETQGNNLEKVISTIQLAKEKTKNKKPIAILLHTEMGFGVDYMMGSHKWHGVAPNDQELELALNQLNESLGDY